VNPHTRDPYLKLAAADELTGCVTCCCLFCILNKMHLHIYNLQSHMM